MMSSQPGPSAAFLLAQLGAVATERFAMAVADLALTPPLSGILRVLRTQPGLSQQELARRLKTPPSRLVGYLDQLQARGAITRATAEDRRINLITLTPAGTELLRDLTRVALTHNDALLESLTSTQRTQLTTLLSTLANDLGLDAAVHPGYAQTDDEPNPS
jgi:DNA-binding MarR family transcriptional regulator